MVNFKLAFYTNSQIYKINNKTIRVDFFIRTFNFSFYLKQIIIANILSLHKSYCYHCTYHINKAQIKFQWMDSVWAISFFYILMPNYLKWKFK